MNTKDFLRLGVPLGEATRRTRRTRGILFRARRKAVEKITRVRMKQETGGRALFETATFR